MPTSSSWSCNWQKARGVSVFVAHHLLAEVCDLCRSGISTFERRVLLGRISNDFLDPKQKPSSPPKVENRWRLRTSLFFASKWCGRVTDFF